MNEIIVGTTLPRPRGSEHAVDTVLRRLWSEVTAEAVPTPARHSKSPDEGARRVPFSLD